MPFNPYEVVSSQSESVGIRRSLLQEKVRYFLTKNASLYIVTQVATFYKHSTPLECNSLKYAPSIDISPLNQRQNARVAFCGGEESA